MSAKILVVDDTPHNVKLLADILGMKGYAVTTATHGQEALDKVAADMPDLILLDIMMPGLSGYDVCNRLRADPATALLPIVLCTSLDPGQERVKGIEAGADDFLTKPVSDVALIARVRSLARLKMMTDELRMRAVTSKEIGIQEMDVFADGGRAGRILIVDDRQSSHERIAAMLADEHVVEVEANSSDALFHAAEGNYDLVIVSLALEKFDALRLCSQIRSLERTRNVPVLAVCEPDDNARMVRGLEIGVNDYLMRPIDRNELMARARTQIRKKRYTERLRDNVQQSIEMAITDALTGLYNRRYMETHLSSLVEQAASRGKPLTALVLDIDYFKSVNDTHGHDAGDDVLREFATRIKKSIRGIDLACRFGGEEFVIIMPETDMGVATIVAERLRRRIASERFPIQQGTNSLEVTISIGLATLDAADDNAGSILKRADQALYRAKRDGRNRVVADAA